jgi:hypothetical protein
MLKRISKTTSQRRFGFPSNKVENGRSNPHQAARHSHALAAVRGRLHYSHRPPPNPRPAALCAHVSRHTMLSALRNSHTYRYPRSARSAMGQGLPAARRRRRLDACASLAPDSRWWRWLWLWFSNQSTEFGSHRAHLVQEWISYESNGVSHLGLGVVS